MMFSNTNRRLVFVRLLYVDKSFISAPLSDFYQNVVAIDLHRISRYFDCAIHKRGAGAHVKLPAMPRTRHDYSIKNAFAQRTAPVRADIGRGVKSMVNAM